MKSELIMKRNLIKLKIRRSQKIENREIKMTRNLIKLKIRRSQKKLELKILEKIYNIDHQYSINLNKISINIKLKIKLKIKVLYLKKNNNKEMHNLLYKCVINLTTLFMLIFKVD